MPWGCAPFAAQEIYPASGEDTHLPWRRAEKWCFLLLSSSSDLTPLCNSLPLEFALILVQVVVDFQSTHPSVTQS